MRWPDYSFTFRGLTVDCTVHPGDPGTRECPPTPRYCDEWEVAAVADGDEFLGFLPDDTLDAEETAAVSALILPQRVRVWVEENWGRDIAERADEEAL